MTSRPQWNLWTFWHLVFLLILQLINSCLRSTLKLYKHLLNIVLFCDLPFLTHMNFELEDFSLCSLKSILSKIDRLFPLFRTCLLSFGLTLLLTEWKLWKRDLTKAIRDHEPIQKMSLQTRLNSWSACKRDFRKLYEEPGLNFPPMGSGQASCRCLISLLLQHWVARGNSVNLDCQLH